MVMNLRIKFDNLFLKTTKKFGKTQTKGVYRQNNPLCKLFVQNTELLTFLNPILTTVLSMYSVGLSNAVANTGCY